MSVSAELVIAGIGVTPTGRALPQSLGELAMRASLAACADAGLDPRQIDGLLSESSHFAALLPDIQAALGLGPHTFSAHIGLHGAGAVATPILAGAALSAGLASTFLCVFGVSLSAEGGPGAFHAVDPYKRNLEMPLGFYPQPVYMACMANRYLAEYGVDAAKLGAVPISAREWAGLHPTAQCRDPLGRGDYESSRMVADPLRALDCCLIGDGAAAFVLTTRERAADLRQPPVAVAGVSRAVEPVAEHEYLSVRPDQLHLPSRWSGPAALAQAGISPDDVDVAYLYDCFSIIPALQLEDIGFCGRGEGLDLYAAGHTRPGGRLPVNTDGGLMSHSFVPGMNAVVEAVTQLRGDADGPRQVRDARVGVVGAWSAHEHTTLVLTGG